MGVVDFLWLVHRVISNYATNLNFIYTTSLHFYHMSDDFLVVSNCGKFVCNIPFRYINSCREGGLLSLFFESAFKNCMH